MIHHISFPANDPRHVADVLAELMDGRTYPFPGVPGSFIAVSGDPHGTAIEVHAADMLLEPSGPRCQPIQLAPHRGAFHMFLSVPLSREQVEAIGRREVDDTVLRSAIRGFAGARPKAFFPLD